MYLYIYFYIFIYLSSGIYMFTQIRGSYIFSRKLLVVCPHFVAAPNLKNCSTTFHIFQIPLITYRNEHFLFLMIFVYFIKCNEHFVFFDYNVIRRINLKGVKTPNFGEWRGFKVVL